MEGEQDEPTQYASKQLEEFKKRKAEREKKEMKTFEKILRQKEQGVQLTSEAETWFQKKVMEDPKAGSKVQVRQLAQKSLDSGNWAGQLMKGSSEKFSCVGKKTVDNALVQETAGLVTYEDYKRKKQDLEEKEEAGTLGGEEHEEEAKKDGKRRKKEKRVVLSFDADEDEET
mmetsp:Transcript_3749/g.7148  ORF Transcript_3749/g.7148 Transcript_3749/m.7148 type:complete len:172 (+) Transcript_3749:50-565(+)